MGCQPREGVSPRGGSAMWGVVVGGGGSHYDDTYRTPQGRPIFVAFGLKIQQKQVSVCGKEHSFFLLKI